ncbi:alpha-ketoglutarate-dependent dioxygenase alkB homolog 7, mitochondrial-like isoform X1 [Acipenser ruthenus]|uniref:alpha-ketoglutarate-dependent dioxygenase alkB homolog 7, mitochondrial-like isoform X1 n=1 Tax=Acipenser ruthenus TaxID=7906 RepID=UPI00274053D1|nr:alpha-ketoglutarate-dependent dioxygenase alkB homolog 7, mitochondrial-like isoform X1 [Acipenser ruthenus]
MRPRFSLLSSPVRFKALFGSSLLPRSRLGAPGLALSGSRSVVGSGPAVLELVSGQVEVREEFISEEEERELLGELEPVLKRKRYEFDHWDNAIHGYRETERSHWSERNSETLQRVRDVAFPPGTPQLGPVHVLDVDKGGYIKPHVDSVKFCGSTIAGLSLLSPSVMRLVSEQNQSDWVDLLLLRRSLYILRGAARYLFTHQVLKEGDSYFGGVEVPRGRRVSVICRSLPSVA